MSDLREDVAYFTTRVAEKLRRGQLATGVITVFVHTDRFVEGPQYYNIGTYTLAYSMDSTQELLCCALDSLVRIYREGFNYRKAGVMLNSLSLVDQLTLRMFGNEKVERFRQVMVAVGQIDHRGPGHNPLRDSEPRWQPVDKY